jgi:hypothetical protein
MWCRFFADTLTVMHTVFVAFVVLGGLLALRWPRVAWLHGPAALWGVLVEWAGWVCPLTPLENWLRLKGQGQGYGGGFVEHYLVPVLYPAALSTGIQFVLGALVIAVNVLIYGYVIQARRRRARSPG